MVINSCECQIEVLEEEDILDITCKKHLEYEMKLMIEFFIHLSI